MEYIIEYMQRRSWPVFVVYSIQTQMFCPFLMPVIRRNELKIKTRSRVSKLPTLHAGNGPHVVLKSVWGLLYSSLTE